MWYRRSQEALHERLQGCVPTRSCLCTCSTACSPRVAAAAGAACPCTCPSMAARQASTAVQPCCTCGRGMCIEGCHACMRSQSNAQDSADSGLLPSSLGQKRSDDLREQQAFVAAIPCRCCVRLAWHLSAGRCCRRDSGDTAAASFRPERAAPTRHAGGIRGQQSAQHGLTGTG